MMADRVTPPPTNILFIMTDQQRWDSLPCYGLDFIHAPNLDRLAREGMVFERAYTPAPLCVPARAALLTGQWPGTLGVLGNADWFTSASNQEGCVPVWPDALTRAGYRTASIGKMHFNPWDASMGFVERITAEDKRLYFWPDDYSKFLQMHGLDRQHPAAFAGYAETLQAPVFPHDRELHIDSFIGSQAAAWIRRNAGGTRPPFAAWIGFAGPHDPYDPPADMASMYYDAPIPKPIPRMAGAPVEESEQLARENPFFRIELGNATDEHYRLWRAHYYANISLIDHQIGAILEALELTGTLDTTLIVFTSDHGDALGDHGLVYKDHFFESMAHVPLIVRGPGVAAGTRATSLASTLDLIPAFYRAANLTPPPSVQSADIGVAFNDPPATIRYRVTSELLGRVMVRNERFKYVHYRNRPHMLYDMTDDPNEERNLIDHPAHVGDLAHMRGLLGDYLLETGAGRAVIARREASWHRNWAVQHDPYTRG